MWSCEPELQFRWTVDWRDMAELQLAQDSALVWSRTSASADSAPVWSRNFSLRGMCSVYVEPELQCRRPTRPPALVVAAPELKLRLHLAAGAEPHAGAGAKLRLPRKVSTSSARRPPPTAPPPSASLTSDCASLRGSPRAR